MLGIYAAPKAARHPGQQRARTRSIPCPPMRQHLEAQPVAVEER
jgi:hypothetical protein